MNAFEQLATGLESYTVAVSGAAKAFAELGQAAERARHKLDPLTAMGFDDGERGQIINLCSVAGWDQVQFGQMVIASRPIPQMDWNDLFTFSWHWRIVARQAFWLALALILAAVTG